MRISDWSSDVCSSDLKIFAELCPVLKKDAILATNTSSISVTRLASATDRPEKFMGMHFMNPVPVMQLVELIRGIATEEETFRQVRELTVKLGKTPAHSEDFPARSEERRVGQEGVSTGRSRWSPEH